MSISLTLEPSKNNKFSLKDVEMENEFEKLYENDSEIRSVVNFDDYYHLKPKKGKEEEFNAFIKAGHAFDIYYLDSTFDDAFSKFFGYNIKTTEMSINFENENKKGHNIYAKRLWALMGNEIKINDNVIQFDNLSLTYSNNENTQDVYNELVKFKTLYEKQ